MWVTKIDGTRVASYTKDEMDQVLEMSLTSIARSIGFTPMPCGTHFKIKEMDSLIIYNDRTWNRFSGRGNITHGSQIDFVMEFVGIETVPLAINYLLDLKGAAVTEKQYIPKQNVQENIPKREMVLPPKNKDSRRVFAYLTKTRGLSEHIVNIFLKYGIIYEDAVHHNIVFCGRDPEGNIKYGGLRGTMDFAGKKFRMDLPGNDKHYGVNIINPKSDELKVFEATIDMMSYMDVTHDMSSNKLALGMVEDTPLIQLLKDYDHIKKITFCLDNDEAGLNAMLGNKEASTEKRRMGYKKYYEMQGYSTSVELPTVAKDWNEYLNAIKSQVPLPNGGMSHKDFTQSVYCKIG